MKKLLFLLCMFLIIGCFDEGTTGKERIVNHSLNTIAAIYARCVERVSTLNAEDRLVGLENCNNTIGTVLQNFEIDSLIIKLQQMEQTQELEKAYFENLPDTLKDTIIIEVKESADSVINDTGNN